MSKSHDIDAMEAERPKGYTEFISGDTSWQEVGMRFKWTKPRVPGTSTVNMLDPLFLRVCVECKKPVPLRDLSAYAWTCVYHKDNIEGIYREVPLPYDTRSRRWDDNGVTTYEFKSLIYPTHNDEFRLTFNVKFGKLMIWADLLKTDHKVTVTLPKEVNMWTKTASSAMITDNLYIGNYLAVLLAEELFFDAMLILQAGIDGQLALSKVVKKSKTEVLPMGAGMEIPSERVQMLVTWLRKVSKDYSKVLVGDKEGQGRAGSAMTAYIFANNPNLTFQEAYQLVQNRKTIYCHKGLNATLHRLYPRD